LNAHREEPLKVGELLICVCGKYHICNAITQEFYGRDKNVVYVDYDAVEKSLTQVAHYALTSTLDVHLPFIGAGLANGDEKRLLSIFKKVFDGVSATLWLHTPSRPIRKSSSS
jgi:hypothetical protein